jgi:hypothetical protein
MDCPESIRPFWISWELLMQPWCNLAASQRRPYCTSVNSHSPMGLVSQQWDAADWERVLCDRRIHNDRASRSDNAPAHSTALVQAFLAKHHITQVCQPPLLPRFGSPQLLAFPKTKIAIIEREETCESDGHTVHKLSQRCLTANGPAPWESDCSRCTVRSPLTGC